MNKIGTGLSFPEKPRTRLCGIQLPSYRHRTCSPSFGTHEPDEPCHGSRTSVQSIPSLFPMSMRAERLRGEVHATSLAHLHRGRCSRPATRLRPRPETECLLVQVYELRGAASLLQGGHVCWYVSSGVVVVGRSHSCEAASADPRQMMTQIL